MLGPCWPSCFPPQSDRHDRERLEGWARGAADRGVPEALFIRERNAGRSPVTGLSLRTTIIKTELTLDAAGLFSATGCDPSSALVA